uniref:TRAP transporter large permease subunit n=1 Tax=Actibacterium sp. TaxID=1872125 RepID=UPI003561B7AB
IVLLGTLAGDIYSTAQETRAQLAGCSDALTYLGQAAVVSVGTLFQAAILPGVMLAFLYGAYAFGYALLKPEKAPPVTVGGGGISTATRQDKLTWFLVVPAGIIAMAIAAGSLNIAGSQDMTVSSFSDLGDSAVLRTNVSDQCKVSMIDLHGQEKWDLAVEQQAQIDAAGGAQTSTQRSAEEIAAVQAAMVASAPPLSTPIMIGFVLLSIIIAAARGVAPLADPRPLVIGAVGIGVGLLVDALFLSPLASPGQVVVRLAIPLIMALYGVRYAMGLLSRNELLRVAFPPLVLIVAVLGSILGGITNPTPAAALGAGGAIMLAAYRKLRDEQKSGKIIIWASLAVGVMILAGTDFDLRVGLDTVRFEDWIAFGVAQIAYHFAMFGLLYACWVLWRTGVLKVIVRETAKVTSMVFTILIGSQLLNLVVISFGGEHYIQAFLRSFDNEFTVFLLVMLVLFFLGFVLDFLEIIYIVVPIVGPVIYGGTFDPKWVTIMIAVNLQTSFLTPPFGFALFYLRGVAPPEVSTGHIYRGIVPFVLIQVVGLGILWFFPSIVTIVPSLLTH